MWGGGGGGGGRVSKAKILKGSVGLNWIFQRGGGNLNLKKLLWKGYGNFLEHHITT